ncbi:MAG TPA: hypothetical protein VEB40_06305 [Flavipsychrobacter sp.]|nr:hypothetical protein [Flavipsychrobacter sp.]
MKKFLVIPLMLIYLLSASGIVCYAHYCGSELVSVNMYTETDGCEDGGCGDESEEPDDCCKDEVITAKVMQDQNSNQIFKLKFNSGFIDIAPVQFVSFDGCAACSVHYTSKVNNANAPPGPWQSIPLYKLHSCFTYYG